MGTFDGQSALGELPVPPLHQTLEKYLDSVRPFLSPTDYDVTVSHMRKFSDGQGKQLQQRLLERHSMAHALPVWTPQYSTIDTPCIPSDGIERPTRNSWLIDWWNQYSYLRFRDSVVLNVSFFFVFDYAAHLDQFQRASLVIYHALCFKYQFANRTLEPDTMRKDPLCMNQFHYLFNSCRVPRIESDHVEIFDPLQHRYICLAVNGHFYRLNELDPATGQPWSITALDHMLRRWHGSVKTLDEDITGALSAAHRDKWSTAYASLMKLSPENHQSVRTLQSSSFLVCLDSAAPLTREEMAHFCWHGYGKNRWFDKTIQFIVFKNGRAGFLGEHSMVDATTPSRLCDYIIQQSITASQSVNDDVDGRTTVPDPTPLPITLPNDLKILAQDTLGDLHKQISAHDVQVLNYTRYGKGFVKSQRMSPDSFVQMAIQYAYSRLMGINCATYESAGMKRYHWGRTETCRSVSAESVAFCRVMDDPAASNEAKRQAIRSAVEVHSKYMAECIQGHGVDRHLLGLRLSLTKDEAMPNFFLDPAYNLSCHWTLSTSQIPSDLFEGYGWGEVVPDGFGVAYMVREDRFMFNLAGLVGQDVVPDLDDADEYDAYFVEKWKEMRVKWFHACLQESLDRLYEVLNDTAPMPPSVATTMEKQPEPVSTKSSSEEKKQVERRPSGGSIKLPSRPPSIHSLPAHLGLSLAYPRRSDQANIYSATSVPGEKTGVVGEDVGLIEFEFAWGSSKSKPGSGSAGGNGSGNKSAGNRTGKKLIRLLKGWTMGSSGSNQ